MTRGSSELGTAAMSDSTGISNAWKCARIPRHLISTQNQSQTSHLMNKAKYNLIDPIEEMLSRAVLSPKQRPRPGSTSPSLGEIIHTPALHFKFSTIGTNISSTLTYKDCFGKKTSKRALCLTTRLAWMHLHSKTGLSAQDSKIARLHVAMAFMIRVLSLSV